MHAPARDGRTAFAKMVKRDGWNLDEPSEAVTLAAFMVGPNVRRISKFLGRPERWCQEPARNLRANGCWVGSKIAVEDPDEVGGIELLVQAGVARGWYERASAH